MLTSENESKNLAKNLLTKKLINNNITEIIPFEAIPILKHKNDSFSLVSLMLSLCFLINKYSKNVTIIIIAENINEGNVILVINFIISFVNIFISSKCIESFYFI